MEDGNHTDDELSDSLHDLLRGINSPINPSTDFITTRGSNTVNGEAHAASSSRSSLPLPTAASSTRSTSRHTVISRSRVSNSDGQLGLSDVSGTFNQVSPPPRSIFVSGPPTASISANTAHASISNNVGSSSSHPLSALTSPGLNLRANKRPVDLNLIASGSGIPGTEKDVDDLDAALNNEAQDIEGPTTSQRLSTMFTSDSPGLLSREPTRNRSLAATPISDSDTSTLLGHLLYSGFLEGKHSDITIHAFGHSYKLHKLLLDRAPYFATAFCGSWKESSAQELTVMPEQIDTNITQAAFELALKRLYGASIPSHEEREAIGLFATACWLDMSDLVDNCVDYILKQMTTAKLHELIRLVTNSYYGRPGDRILASAKAMLCRDGWEMPYEYWDYIPAEIVREIIGGDPFYVPGEWERWFLSLKILNRRLRRLAIEAGLVGFDGVYLRPPPQSLKFFAMRFDATYRRDAGFGAQKFWSEKDDVWCSLYTSPEVSPILVLLDEGIHYVHLRFEQLQHIRSARDILEVPVLPDKVVSDALWMQMELRQKIMNALEGDVELGLSELAEDLDSKPSPDTISETTKGKQREDDDTATDVSVNAEMDSGSWDGNGQPRKFWIPSTDVSCIIGGARDAVATPAATSSGDWTSHATRLSANLEPSDVAWAVDFAGSVFESTATSRNISSTSAPRFSHYPPFRFSAEFPNPRTLKEKKRVYSQTVWYAGSLWNLYIQRGNTSKGQHLGIYLHRARDKDPHDDPYAQFVPAMYSVDDRIGQLEREMLLRKTTDRPQTTTAWRDSTVQDQEDPSSSGQEFSANTSTLLSPSRSVSLRENDDAQRTSPHTPRVKSTSRRSYNRGSSMKSDDRMPDSPSFDVSLIRANQNVMSSTTTMPPYTDRRSTIKTYFKIYSPSKGGRLLSIYESAPDSFNFGKSWGWKTSQLVLDDGMGIENTGKPPMINLNGKDGRLRYMVVIGNI